MNDNTELDIGTATVRILIPSRRKDGAIVSPELRSTVVLSTTRGGR